MGKRPSRQKAAFVAGEHKDADHPAHSRSLISTFNIHCLESMIYKVGTDKNSKFWLFSVAEQTVLSFAWLEIPQTAFCHNEDILLYL